MPRSLALDAQLAEYIRQELQTQEACPTGDELVNAVVDVMVQANVNLQTVSLDDMKRLLGDVLEHRRRSLCCCPVAAS